VHARRILRSVLCLSPSTSNGHDVSRDIISQVPTWRKWVLKLQDRRSDVGGNADAKLGSGRMAARATARSRSCGSPDFGLVRGRKIWSQDAGETKYRHRGVCFGDSALCGWAHRCHRKIESATRTSASLMHSITPADAHCEQVIKVEKASSRVSHSHSVHCTESIMHMYTDQSRALLRVR
jgi:hypothetical protein